MNKSTQTWYPKNETHTHFSKKHNKDITGTVVKEKLGYIWVQLTNRIHRFKKF